MSRIQITKSLRRDQPASPKSFASPELSEIQTPAAEVPPMPFPLPSFPLPSYINVTNDSDEDYEPDVSEEHVNNSRVTTSSLPRVQLEISRDSISDWFPSDLFSSDKFNFTEANTSTSGANGAVAAGEPSGRVEEAGSGIGDAEGASGSTPDTRTTVENANEKQEETAADESHISTPTPAEQPIADKIKDSSPHTVQDTKDDPLQVLLAIIFSIRT